MQNLRALPQLSTNLNPSSLRLEFRHFPNDYRREAGSTWRTVKLSDVELQDVKRWVDALLAQKPTPAESVGFARLIMGRYRTPDLYDPKIFAATLSAMFAAHSLAAAQKICDATSGIHTHSNFLPSLAEVAKAIEEFEQPIILVGRSAEIVIQSRAEDAEAEERRQQQQDEWRKRREAGMGAGGGTGGSSGPAIGGSASIDAGDRTGQGGGGSGKL